MRTRARRAAPLLRGGAGLLCAASLRAAVVLSAAAALAACGATGPDRQPLRVFAASSLTDAFREMAGAFEGAHPDTDVVLVFAGSQVLRLQIEQGAPADVFASANPRHMEALVEGGLVNGERVLARNELVVIVPPANPAGIESFADLVRAERIVIGTPHVPVGAYAREALRRAGSGGGDGAFEEEVLDRIVSEESNVRLVRAKVELGEADAAIVYRTDAVAGRVRTVQLPPRINVRAHYLIGMVEGAGNAAAAERWAEFVASPEGRRILSRHGFLAETTATAQ